MSQLGSLAYIFGPRMPLIIIFGVVLALIYFGVAFSGQTAGYARASRKRALGVRGGSKRKSMFSFASRGLEEKARENEEFATVMRTSPSQYNRRTLLYLLLTAGVTFIVTESIVLMISVGVVTYTWHHGRAAGRIRKEREKALRDELLPFARYISRTLERSSNMYEALGDLARTDPVTPLVASIKRALSSTQTLEAGLRAEESYATQKVVREFFEILAEGASSTSRMATTMAALNRYYELNLRVRTVYQKALQITSQARSTRMFLTGLIPFFYILAILRVGPDLMFHTFGGNVITALSVGAIAIAYLLSNRSINGVLKGF